MKREWKWRAQSCCSFAASKALWEMCRMETNMKCAVNTTPKRAVRSAEFDWEKSNKRNSGNKRGVRHFLLRILPLTVGHPLPSSRLIVYACLQFFLLSCSIWELVTCVWMPSRHFLSLSFQATEWHFGWESATDSVLKLQNGYADTVPTASRVLSRNRNSYLPFIS